MSEVCVCGHPKESHWQSVQGTTAQMCLFGWSEENPQERCRCPLFRPELPWPDSEGWYWCDNASFGLAYAFLATCEGLEQQYIITTTNDDEYREAWESKYGPTRFTKLLEENPFTP